MLHSASIRSTLIFFVGSFVCSRALALDLSGDWIQSTTGEKMSIDGNDNVVFQPVVGNDLVRAKIATGAMQDGGNLAISFEKGWQCIYRATVLERQGSINLKLLSGPSASTTSKGCTYGLFLKADRWPNPPLPLSPPSDSSAPSPPSQSAKHDAGKVTFRQLMLPHRQHTLPFSGSANFEWKVNGTILTIVVPFTNVRSKNEGVAQARKTLKSVSDLLNESLKDTNP